MGNMLPRIMPALPEKRDGLGQIGYLKKYRRADGPGGIR